MKKNPCLLILSIVLIFTFASCSMFDTPEDTGSLSFELSSDFINKITAHRSARDAWGPSEGDDDDDEDWGEGGQGSQYQEKYIDKRTAVIGKSNQK